MLYEFELKNINNYTGASFSRLPRLKIHFSCKYQLDFQLSSKSDLLLDPDDKYEKLYIIIALHEATPVQKLASWSSGNAFVSGAGGLRFKSRAGQIQHRVANGSPPLRHFFKRSYVARAQ